MCVFCPFDEINCSKTKARNVRSEIKSESLANDFKSKPNIDVAKTSQINTEISTDFAHTHNVVYEAICPSGDCGKRYIGETGRRLSVRAKEHLGEKSHHGQHTIRTGHRPVTLNDFKILSSGFTLPRDRKLAEARC